VSRSASVRAFVLSARRRWLAARWVENALAGGAAACLALAAAALSGATPGSEGRAAAAGLCGVLAALTLAAERRRSVRCFAQSLDQWLGEAGALATAFECEERAGAGPLAALHVARTASRLDRSRLRAAVSPPSPVFLAALAVAAALAALASELGQMSMGRPSPAVLAGAALSRVTDLAARGEGLAPAEIEQALRDAAGLVDLEAASPAERAQTEEALELLLAGRNLGAGSRSAARDLLERLRQTAAGPARGSGSGAGPAGAGPAGSGEPPVAAGPPGRTMSGPPEATSSVPATRPSPVPAPSAAAAGPPAGRWWPRRHAAVVSGYVERTRAALERVQVEQR